MTAIHVSVPAPRYIFVGRDQHVADRISAILARAGWANTTNLDGNLHGCNLAILVASAPVPVGLSSSIPRLGVGTGDARNLLVDDTIDPNASDEDIAALIAQWRPTPDAARFAEVATGFGNAAIAPIARGLSAHLQQAIADLDAGNFAQAHRIAGLAGTLGFRRTSTAWLAIDEGDTSQTPAARREGRLAMAAIERWLTATGFARESGA